MGCHQQTTRRSVRAGSENAFFASQWLDATTAAPTFSARAALAQNATTKPNAAAAKPNATAAKPNAAYAGATPDAQHDAAA